jgi:predicted RNase H-like nuclease (RuvC/YqgF family)
MTTETYEKADDKTLKITQVDETAKTLHKQYADLTDAIAHLNEHLQRLEAEYLQQKHLLKKEINTLEKWIKEGEKICPNFKPKPGPTEEPV